MSQHEQFIYRADELVQIAETFNNDCIGTFDLEALKYFYEHINGLMNVIKNSLRIAKI